MKKILKNVVVSVCLMLCAVFALAACGDKQAPKTCKEYLAELVTAKSFTVTNNGNVVLECSNIGSYWRYEYDGEYNQYYLYPDKDNKKWVYGKYFSEDKWLKMAMTDAYYGECLIWQKNSWGLDYGFMDFMKNVSLNFDTFMIANGNKYKLKDKVIEYVDSLEMWIEGNTLAVSLTGEDFGNYNLIVSNLNSTVVTLSADAIAATVGDVDML